MLQDIKAVIFDVDGTLVDSMWIWKQVDIEFLARRNIELPVDLQKDIEGMSYTATAEYFRERFQLPETVEEIKEEWREMADDFYNNRIPLKAGVKELLQIIKENRLKIGIATSNSRELVETMLKKHEIGEYFDGIRTSCEVPRSKPFPDVYLQAAEDLCVKPGECLVFEDTVAGATAAKAAGMRVVAVYDEISAESRQHLEQLAELYIMDFNKFINKISSSSIQQS
ncbi:MAG TPA: HAD family phosphatase [Patescibacteria group bacterium]|nr:HAD family phosphatase [Patescibacteria group bacterium]